MKRLISSGCIEFVGPGGTAAGRLPGPLTAQLDSGAASRSAVVLGFSESTEHKGALADVIENSGIVVI